MDVLLHRAVGSFQQPDRQRQPDQQGVLPEADRADAAVVVAFVDFLVSFTILIGLMVWYQFLPGWQIVLLPFLSCWRS